MWPTNNKIIINNKQASALFIIDITHSVHIEDWTALESGYMHAFI